MSPTIDERLASLIRSLSQVVLPHLPADASLAQEQVHLALGHLQILRAQIDPAAAFEAEEAADAARHGNALATLGGPGAALLADAVAAAQDLGARERVRTIHAAIDRFIRDSWAADDAGLRSAVSAAVLGHERDRVQKDRQWCAPFGFDSMAG
ncbi:MAG: hypothetical protein V4579_04675 [Pseudomonadota bacterium]